MSKNKLPKIYTLGKVYIHRLMNGETIFSDNKIIRTIDMHAKKYLTKKEKS